MIEDKKTGGKPMKILLLFILSITLLTPVLVHADIMVKVKNQSVDECSKFVVHVRYKGYFDKFYSAPVPYQIKRGLRLKPNQEVTFNFKTDQCNAVRCRVGALWAVRRLKQMHTYTATTAMQRSRPGKTTTAVCT